MQKVNTHEAKSRLSELIAQVEKTGEAITICRNGKPVARLVAIPRPPIDPFQTHPELQGIEFLGDNEATAPIDKAFWPEEWRP